MPTEPPVACSLTATELPQRLAEMADLGRAALVDPRTDALQAQLRFAAGAEVRDRVEAVVAAESRCCAFLTMRVTDEPDAVVLTIEAPEGTEAVLSELVDAFRGRPQVSHERGPARGEGVLAGAPQQLGIGLATSPIVSPPAGRRQG